MEDQLWSNSCMRARKKRGKKIFNYIDHSMDTHGALQTWNWRRWVYLHGEEGAASRQPISPCMHASTCSMASQPGRPIHTMEMEVTIQESRRRTRHAVLSSDGMDG